MPDSLLTLPARLTVRTVRTILTTTRDLSQQALGVVDLIGQLVETPPAEPGPPVPRPRPMPVEPLRDSTPVADDAWDDVPVETVQAADVVEAQLVDEVADPDAGAQVRVDPPWDGYDKLRAADIVARLASADMAELTAIELHETTHRKRRTVLGGIARERKRRH